MKLRTRFTLFSGLLVGSVVIGTTAVSYLREKKRLTQDFQKERFSLVRKLESASLNAILTNDHGLLERTLYDLKAVRPEILWIGVHHAGRFLTHTESRWVGKTPVDQNTLKAIAIQDTTEITYLDDGTEVLELDSPILSGNNRIGTIRIAFSQALLNDQFHIRFLNAMKKIVLIAFMFLVIGVLASLLIAHNITLRLSHLVHAAKSLAKGNFNEKIPVEGSDEIQDLATEFNLMASQLEEYYGKVQKQSEYLSKANLELIHLDMVKKNFFSLVSHELRSPLTTIKGYLAILHDAQGMEDWEKQERHFKIIREEVDRIANMVNEFMDLSRLEAGTFKIEMNHANVKDLIDFVIERIEPITENRGITFSYKMDDSLNNFLGDSERLSQVLINLINNSVKFTHPGKTIHLEAFKVSKGRRAEDIEEVAFRVTDTGEGMTTEVLEKIFDRYYQIERKGKKEGLGLGLAFAKEVVERHGGRIKAESEGIGKGTTITFYIPLKEPKENR